MWRSRTNSNGSLEPPSDEPDEVFQRLVVRNFTTLIGQVTSNAQNVEGLSELVESLTETCNAWLGKSSETLGKQRALLDNLSALEEANMFQLSAAIRVIQAEVTEGIDRINERSNEREAVLTSELQVLRGHVVQELMKLRDEQLTHYEKMDEDAKAQTDDVVECFKAVSDKIALAIGRIRAEVDNTNQTLRCIQEEIVRIDSNTSRIHGNMLRIEQLLIRALGKGDSSDDDDNDDDSGSGEETLAVSTNTLSPITPRTAMRFRTGLAELQVDTKLRRSSSSRSARTTGGGSTIRHQ